MTCLYRYVDAEGWPFYTCGQDGCTPDDNLTVNRDNLAIKRGAHYGTIWKEKAVSHMMEAHLGWDRTIVNLPRISPLMACEQLDSILESTHEE
jgi:hypothetical protein